MPGLFWALLHDFYLRDSGLQPVAHIKSAIVQGYISSIPTKSADKMQFQFNIVRLDGKVAKTRVLISCYKNCPNVQAGEHWQFKVSLKKPRNLANPGGFDQVRWLKAKHINWTGYLQCGPHRQLPSSTACYFLLKKRAALANMLARIERHPSTLGLLQALTIGITTNLTADTWDLFRKTGTTHLMVISGAHISLVAGLVYWIILTSWGYLGLNHRMPGPKIAGPIAVFSALGYALLAGFGIPAQRALVIAAFVFLRHFSGRAFSTWQTWRFALFVVLLIEPHSVTMPGFYLSFIAVAVLLFAGQRFKSRGITKTLVAQIACLCGLTPLTMFWFSYASINGVLANTLAIPWVGFIIIPCAFLRLFAGEWLSIPWLANIFHASSCLLLTYLQAITKLDTLNISHTFQNAYIPITLILAILILAGLPTIRLSPVIIIILLTSFFPYHYKPKLNEAEINVLDVGQGLAVVIKTANHTLIYDTGVAFFKGNNMGNLVLIPYLKKQGIKHLDGIVISHPDMDHRGGLPAIEKAYNNPPLITDNPSTYGHGTSCHNHHPWVWDGIVFEFLGIHHALKSRNNASCILKISSPGGSILLTGDIEKKAEQYLLKHYSASIKADAILIPHHGSKTSSSRKFIDAISPKYAIVSYGFQNRYKFPHRQAIQVYESRKIPVYNTVDSGMISIRLPKANKQLSIHSYRKLIMKDGRLKQLITKQLITID